MLALNGLVVVLHLFLMEPGTENVVKYGTKDFETAEQCKETATRILAELERNREAQGGLPFDTKIICRVEKTT